MVASAECGTQLSLRKRPPEAARCFVARARGDRTRAAGLEDRDKDSFPRLDLGESTCILGHAFGVSFEREAGTGANCLARGDFTVERYQDRECIDSKPVWEFPTILVGAREPSIAGRHVLRASSGSLFDYALHALFLVQDVNN